MRVLQQPRHVSACLPRASGGRRCTRACAHVSRREVGVLLSASALSKAPAQAFEEVPAGFYRHSDKLDGYSFAYPDTWIIVTTSGNDVFYRNSRVADENVFVDISSPSSSKYDSVKDLGTPEDASKKLEEQFLTELMSTRLGVKREIEPVYARSRTGVPPLSPKLALQFKKALNNQATADYAFPENTIMTPPTLGAGKDGKPYYDIGIRIQSFASRQQLAVSDTQRQDAVVKEFDRVLLTTLGVANSRLYEFRMQTPYKKFTKNSSLYEEMSESFRCKEV